MERISLERFFSHENDKSFLLAPFPQVARAVSSRGALKCTGVVAALVRKMMAKVPAERHQSYEELAADLQSAYGSLTEPAKTAPIPPAARISQEPSTLSEDAQRTVPDKNRRRVLLLTLSCAVTLAVGVGLLKSKLASPFSSRPKTIDLLALVNPVRDRVAPGNLGKSNQWEKNGSLLKYVSDGKAGKIVPPAAFHASEYRLEVCYKRLSGSGQWHIDIPLRDEKIVPLILDKAGVKIVHEKGGPSWPASLPSEGKVIIHVKLSEGEEPDTLGFDLGDGSVLPSWSGHLKDFSRPVEYHGDFPKQPVTSLFSMRDSYEFSKWTVTPITGSIDVLR